MLRDIRGASHQRILTDSADLHHIIRDKTMPSLDQLQRRLGLTDAALARDQHALAVYVHQHAVHGDTGSQLHIQPADHFRHTGRSSLLAHQDRHAVLDRDLPE